MVTKALNKWLYFALLGLVLAACSMQSDTERFIATDPESYVLGEQVYAQNCLSCHGINGVGQNPENPQALDATGRYVAPPHNDNGHTWHHDDDLLFSYIHDGGMGDPSMFKLMPVFGAR
jgi:cytochrome c2